MSCYTLEPKSRPRWWQIRWVLSSALVRLAKKIRPECPCVSAYFAQAIIDYQICGKFVQRIDPAPKTPDREVKRA